MKKIFLFIPLIFILFNGCFGSKKHDGAKVTFEEFKELVRTAIDGNERANDTLSTLVDLNLAVNVVYNKLDFDTIVIDKSTYYALLLEYPNPALNRFAIYDKSLNLYLLDKSLSGHLNLQKIEFLNFSIFGIIEEFVAKDAIYLKRLSLYRVTKDSVNLAMRSYLEYFSPAIKLEQRVAGITESAVYTKLSIPASLRIDAIADTFFLDNKTNSYASYKNYFENIVTSQIDSFKNEQKYNQIKDPATLKSSLSNNEANKPVGYTYYTHQYDKFKLYVPSDWKFDNNVKIDKLLKKDASGAHFYDVRKNSGVYVIRMKGQETSEDFMNDKFVETINKQITFKSSARTETKENITQFFEISCGAFRYLVVLVVPVEEFNAYRNIYEYIIKSFNIDC